MSQRGRTVTLEHGRDAAALAATPASTRTRAIVLAGGIGFLVFATLNSGGYRYGASDQSFYIPAILAHLDSALFPRDGALLAPQARYFLVDEIVAGLIARIGGSIELWFLVGQAATLLLLYGALLVLGRTMYRSPLAIAALVAAETLRHRITKTGVNTLEGYFHPRVLVFAIGVAATALFLRGRPRLALVLALAGGVLHPTTAAFFVILIGVGAWVVDRRARPALAAGAAAAAALVLWALVAGPWRGALAPMDAEWRALLSSKDYLFPVQQWRLDTWAINLGTAALAIGTWWARRRAGVAGPYEHGLLAGAIVLLAGFVIVLPLVAWGSTLLIQLQVTRVFWVLELLAIVGVVWWLVDRPAFVPGRQWMSPLVVGVLVGAAVLRGLWVGTVERDRDIFQPGLPNTDWTRALDWLKTHASKDAHVLADPGHAWKFGVPVRVAGFDVYLEDVKDTAMALYSRDVAERVLTRTRALGSFDALDAARARELAAAYDLDYLITTTPLELPLAGTSGRFRIYRLDGTPAAAAR